MGQQSVTKSAQKTMGHKKSSSVAEVAGPHHEVFANVAQTLRLCLKLCVTWITFRIRTTTLFGWLRSFGDTANASLFTWRVECELLHGLAKRIHEWSCVAARGLCFSGLNSQQDWFSEKGVYLCWGCAATHASEECWWGVSVFNYERWHRCPQKRQHQQGWQQHDSSVPLSFSRAVQKKKSRFWSCLSIGWLMRTWSNLAFSWSRVKMNPDAKGNVFFSVQFVQAKTLFWSPTRRGTSLARFKAIYTAEPFQCFLSNPLRLVCFADA